MQELITRLTEKAGISPEQASKAITAIKEFVKEKFPMMSGAVDNLLGEDTAPVSAPTEPVAEVHTEGHSILDKISNVIPGSAGEKVEGFAKNAAHKAEDVFDGLKDKFSGMFGGDKK